MGREGMGSLKFLDLGLKLEDLVQEVLAGLNLVKGF